MEQWNHGPNAFYPRSSNIPVFHYSNVSRFQHSGLYHLSKQFPLFEGHLPGTFFRPFMLIADQVKHAMDHQQDHHFRTVETETVRLALGSLSRNHQISEKVGVEGGELPFSHWEGQDVGRFIPTEVLPIQRLNLAVVHQQEAEFRLKKPQVG